MGGNKEDSQVPEAGQRILVVTAVAAEKDAVLRGLRGLRGRGNVDVLAAGAGPAAAAAGTAAALADREYDLVISAGIAGGFAGRTDIGTLVIAGEIVAADLGAQTPEGFRSLDELGFGTTRVEVDGERGERVTSALLAAGLKAAAGPVLTVSTVTGTAATAAELAGRVPGAAAEAMEGYGVAIAAHARNLPVMEIRAVSNLVGPRDRAAWRIDLALEALEKAIPIIVEVLS